MIEFFLQVQHLNDLIHIRLIYLVAVKLDWQHDILVYIQNWHQVIILKHKTDISPAKYSQLFVIHSANFFSADFDTSRSRYIQPAKHIEQCRFSLSCQVISKKNCRFLQLKETILIASSVLGKDFSSPTPVLAFPSFL